MHAFVGHESARDILRLLYRYERGRSEIPCWPLTSRRLPQAGECVSGQRTFAAARVGETLSGLGLASRPFDLLVPTRGARGGGDAVRAHVWSGVLPRESLLRVSDDLLVSGPELVVVQLCSSHGKLDSLLDAHVEAVRAELELAGDAGPARSRVVDHPLEWERIRRLVAATVVACEFAGTYRLGAGAGTASYHAPKIMSAEGLRRVAQEVGRSPGARRVSRVGTSWSKGRPPPWRR